MIVRLTHRARGMVAGGVRGVTTIVATAAGADIAGLGMHVLTVHLYRINHN
jgi:hypothetical protein